MSWAVASVRSWKTQGIPLASFRPGTVLAPVHSARKESVVMTKTPDIISEIIRNPKHPFRKADDQPEKAQRHRYERRKVKEFIRLGTLVQERPA
jgi:hypothetical protein